MKAALRVVAAAALLSACESAPIWQKAGASEATMKEDGATCHAKARVTPEAAIFLPNRKLAYHGRIDDRYIDFGKARNAPTTHDLEAALEAVIAGKPVPSEATRAVGCYLADLQ